MLISPQIGLQKQTKRFMQSVVNALSQVVNSPHRRTDPPKSRYTCVELFALKCLIQRLAEPSTHLNSPTIKPSSIGVCFDDYR